MRWSIGVATISGTKLQIHLTFFLLLAWIGAVGFQQGGAPGALEGVVFVVLAFLCVVLHEFGHVFAARIYGIGTPDVTLLPIGGVARLERMPEKPHQELVVAIAGPLVNVALAIVLVGALSARFDLTDLSDLQSAQASLEGRLAGVNVALVLFNLIPAFPLDGGRMLRALLAFRLSRTLATLIAARTGQAFALLFAFLGLVANPFLLLIAIFIFLAADAENGFEKTRADAEGYVARDAMVSRYESLRPDDTARTAGALLLATTQQEFPVLDETGAFVGMVTRQRLVDALSKRGPDAVVSDFMIDTVERVGDAVALEAVMPKLAASPARSVAVEGGDRRFLGYVSAENAAELFMIARAQKRAAA